jgi:hypothetical protein
MVTVVQQPTDGGGNGMGFLLGVILLIVFVIGLLYYGLPMIQRATATPAAPQINVPDKVDVNVKQE